MDRPFDGADGGLCLPLSSGELERSMDVSRGQLRVVGQDLVNAHALRNQTDDRRHRNARATDARHTAHDAMIRDYPILSHEADRTDTDPSTCSDSASSRRFSTPASHSMIAARAPIIRGSPAVESAVAERQLPLRTPA